MSMSIDIDIHAVLIQEAFESSLARCANRARSREIPTSVTKDDDPRRQGTVDGCQIIGEPIDLLVRGAEWPTVPEELTIINSRL